MTPRTKELVIAYGLSFAIALIWNVTAHAKPRHRHHHHKTHHARPVLDANANSAQVIGGRPSGCPHAYCGCGLARFLGISDKRLNLADAWARIFPHTHARPGAVAVRRYHRHGHGHVMQLVEHIAGSRWLVRDFNGGRHLSWLHERDVDAHNYVFVNPEAQAASLF
jgi:hypothetical protein